MLSIADLALTAPVLAFSQSVKVATSNVGTGGSGTGKPIFSLLSLARFQDESSPKLNITAVKGLHLDKAEVTIGDHLTVELEDVLIQSISVGAIQNGLPIEELGLDFGKVKWTWEEGGVKVGKGWDIIQNKSSSDDGDGDDMFNDFAFFGPGVLAKNFPSNWLPFSSFSTGITIATSTVGSGGGTIGKPDFEPFSIVTKASAQSVKHLAFVSSGAACCSRARRRASSRRPSRSSTRR